ncbi:MAG TPA: GNAT family N-acetyltransferase [Solirubrobacteraceae bacterium]|nr:GNAT family N-acetyltransferase [Solirubrobacteraceae bacterium]
MAHVIATVGEEDLADLLPLMRSYCEFYEVEPADEDLLALSRALIADPVHDGVQLIARDAGDGRRALGFATIFWSWQTLEAGRVGVMNDLFVHPDARGTGVADDLIRACAARAAERGARTLVWETALDNHRAQRVYDRVGAVPGDWRIYELALGPAVAPGFGAQPEM